MKQKNNNNELGKFALRQGERKKVQLMKELKTTNKNLRYSPRRFKAADS